MYINGNDFLNLERKLESMDFYSLLADKDAMYRDFINRLDRREQRSGATARRRVMRPAAIAALIGVIILITGFTVFADSIVGLLKQLKFTGGIANKVEQLELGEEYPPDTNTKIIYEDLEYAEEYKGKSTRFMQKHKFNSLEEAKQVLRFTLPEPKGLDDWELVSVKVFSNGEEILPYAVELIYDKVVTRTPPPPELIGNDGWEKISEGLPEGSGSGSFYVYLTYVGENAAVKIDTTKDINIVQINGIEAVLTGPLPYERGNAYGLTWIQDGIAIKIFPCGCTYDELISFAEAYVSAGSE